MLYGSELLEKIIKFISEKNKKIEIFFFVLTLLSLLCIPFIGINYNLQKYLPEYAQTRQGLELMEREFGYPGSARVMVSDVSLYEARIIRQRISAVEGVDSVRFIDTAGQLMIGGNYLADLDIEKYYKDGCAYYDVQFVYGEYDPVTFKAIDAIEGIIGENGAMAGGAVENNGLVKALTREIPKILLCSLVCIIIMLVLTTDSYFSPILFLVTILIGILINMGTNVVFGEISFVSAAVSAILQLAVSMDYFIFMIQTFSDERKRWPDGRSALKRTMFRTVPTIISAGLTTMVGFFALTFMDFSIGKDVGNSLIKGVVTSVAVVVFLVPALLLRCESLIERMSHRPFIKDGKLEILSKIFIKARIPVGVILLLLVVPATVGQGMIDFTFGTSSLGAGEGTPMYEQKVKIEEKFGYANRMAIVIPNTSIVDERNLAEELEALPIVNSVTSLEGMLPIGIPEGFLPEDTVKLLHNGKYARLILSVAADSESDFSEECANLIKETVAKYYPEDTYFISQITATMDMEKIMRSDYVKTNLITIIGVVLIIFITFRSPLIVIFTVVPIEMAIMLNMFVPYLTGLNLAFLGYLMVSGLQLGSTVDYSILLCNTYMDVRKTAIGKDMAAYLAVKKCIIPVATSALVLVAVGDSLGFICSIEAISQMGRLVARGAFISMFVVLAFVPFLLMVFDGVIMWNRKRVIKQVERVKSRIRNIFKK